MKNLFTILVFLLLANTLQGCSRQNEQDKMLRQAVAIESADECHLCGMLISNFSGPKGELYKKEQSSAVHKFCSTRDMFSFYLDPENKRNVAEMYVHDMSKMPWDVPNDNYFIEAKSAWYVVDSEKRGAMGKTLASFSKQSDAQRFAEAFGGKILPFTEINLAVLM